VGPDKLDVGHPTRRAQKGLVSRDELLKFLADAPADYKAEAF